jgi:hypothetical protein
VKQQDKVAVKANLRSKLNRAAVAETRIHDREITGQGCSEENVISHHVADPEP